MQQAAPPRKKLTLRRLYRNALTPGVAAMLVLLLMAVLGLQTLDQVGNQAEAIVRTSLEATYRVSDIAARTRALNGEIYRLLALRSAGKAPPDMARAFESLAVDVTGLIYELAAYRDHYAEPRHRAAFDQAVTVLSQYRDTVRDLAGGNDELIAAATQVAPYDVTLNSLADRLVSIAGETVADARARSTQATDTARHVGRYFLIMTVMVGAGISLLAWRFGKRQQSILITRHALETEVEARTAELNAARLQAEAALEEAQAARKRLVDTEQMAALGSLVAGVAHEINTPVGTSLTAATLLEERTRQFRGQVEGGQLKKTDLTRYLDMAGETTALMLSNIHRAANLIQSFKQVAVDQTSAERRSFELSEYLDEVLTSLSPQIRKSQARLVVECPRGIEMDSYPGALAQVITNFIMNALTHAFADTSAGEMTVHVTQQGKMVKMMFTDNGKGIPAENLGRIFEPFFTTRRGRGGTGLGLHIVHNIVTQQLNGTIAVASIPGSWTAFTVELPLVVA